ncbi:HEAT repeat domain-containing protein [Bacillus sp. B-jedd]|uniref:HEAT repeat domain-containing protein n=1 Tax=Bacillus sp. B-jedd TaxID=1476857 RepID=UPI0005156747|nr:HEAT repeat domain-containing protein [Bacillus sp. B-jedd]CEG29752.1 HEAT domain-containing protein [Bacillus sp. B-jedd]
MARELVYLFIVTALFIGILFVMLFYLSIRKSAANKTRKQIEEYKETYNPILFEYIVGGNVSRKLVPNNVVQKKAVEELLAKYSEILEGEEERKSLTSMANLHLTEYYRVRLRSRKWSSRMNALYYIEKFNMDTLLKDLFSMLGQKRISRDELTHILRILANFQFINLYDYLNKKYAFLSGFECRNILVRLGSGHFDQFILGFHKARPDLQYAILDVIGVKREVRFLPFLESIFQTYKGEAKLRALKAIGSIGYVGNLAPYLPLAHSEKWEERMMAARLIGAMKAKEGIGDLIRLLHDRSWWVRSQAGQALAKFPEGKTTLQEIAETTEDPFARDMAIEWINKGV